MAIKPQAMCPYCRGTGVITDWVDYGSTKAAMESECDCAFDDEPEGETRKIAGNSTISVWYVPSNAPYPYCVYQDGFMQSENETETAALAEFARATNFTWEA